MYQHLETTKKEYIGKVIKNISRLNDYEIQIDFADETSVIVGVEGDCCSTSIFYEIETPEDYVDAVLEDIDTYDRENKNIDSEEVVFEKIKKYGFDLYQECSSIWNVTFKTTKGLILFRHINSSNGYYDGCVYFNNN